MYQGIRIVHRTVFSSYNMIHFTLFPATLCLRDFSLQEVRQYVTERRAILAAFLPFSKGRRHKHKRELLSRGQENELTRRCAGFRDNPRNCGSVNLPDRYRDHDLFLESRFVSPANSLEVLKMDAKDETHTDAEIGETRRVDFHWPPPDMMPMPGTPDFCEYCMESAA